MTRYSLVAACMAIAAAASVGNATAAETKGPGVLFSESFDDPNVVKRGWYDSTKVILSGKDARASKHPGAAMNTQGAAVWFDHIVVAKTYVGPITMRRGQGR
ncbi:hypothetical protein HQ576_07875 [bacterium]|nr:hypothetical protein [bacterium]